MIYIGTETLRYYFSSIAQSMAALFAVGGIFAIYRFQFIDTQLSSAVKSFKEFYRRRNSYVPIPSNLPAYSLNKIEEDRKKAKFDADEANEWLDKDVYYILLKEFQKNNDDMGILDYSFYFLRLNEAKDAISKRMRLPVILIAIVFLLSLLFLMLIDLLCERTLSIMAVMLLTLTTITIYELFLYIKLCFNLPKTLVFNNILIGTGSLNETRNAVKEKIKNVINNLTEIECERLKSEMEKFLNE